MKTLKYSVILVSVLCLACSQFSCNQSAKNESNTESEATEKWSVRMAETVMSDFPEICRSKKEMPWRKNRILLANGAMISAYGAEQMVLWNNPSFFKWKC